MSEPKQTAAGAPHLRFLVGLSCALAALTACDGAIGGGDGAAGGGSGGTTGGTGSVGPGSDTKAVGPRPLYRLTRREYNNTVHDLLGDTTHPADTFPDDRDRSFLFRRAGLVATQDADLLRSTAEALAATAIKTPASILPCDPTAGEDACATKFISDFGLRAYRRPLNATESMHLTSLYQNARTTLKLSFNDAIAVLLEAILQSPAFLY